MIRRLFFLPLLLAAAPPAETVTLRHDASPLCLACRSFTVTVGPDGQGTIEQRRAGGPADRVVFRWTAAELRDFAQRLKPLRPNGELRLEAGQPLCRAPSTDQDMVDVRWAGGLGGPRHLAWYLGCDMDAHRDLLRALDAAERLPPLARYLAPTR